MTVLVDTSAFYALLDLDDPNHERAVAAFESLHASREPLLSHEYVVVETIALVQRRLGIAVLRRLLDDVMPIAEIVWIDAELHREACDALLAAGRRSISVVDWVSFIVMRRRGIRTAFAFDADFATEGFEILPVPS